MSENQEKAAGTELDVGAMEKVAGGSPILEAELPPCQYCYQRVGTIWSSEQNTDVCANPNCRKPRLRMSGIAMQIPV